MTARVITSEAQREALQRFISEHDLPFTVEIVKGRRRSTEQNRLQRSIINDMAEQLGCTAEEMRAECKLRFGVPILRAENELFCLKYDEHVKGLPYEKKLALMAEPLDMPVTRLMTVAQKTKYLDAIIQHCAEHGIALNIPAEAA